MHNDWEQIYALPFPTVAKCWEQCGGYCCGNFHGTGGRGEVIIPLFPGENTFHAAAQLQGPVRYIPRTFMLPDDTPLHVPFLHCACKGQCQPHRLRPLICRLYPYFPVCDEQGTLIGVEACSLADIFSLETSGIQKCPVFVDDILDRQNPFSQSVRALLQNPQNIFFVMTVNLLCQHLRRALRLCTNDTMQDVEKHKKFSMMLFSLSPWKTRAFADDFQALYAVLKYRYGAACLF